MTLFLDDGDVRLYHGDAVEQLRLLPDGCVDMVATSPPFYGLRDYGTGEWEGGDEGCDHSIANPSAEHAANRQRAIDKGYEGHGDCEGRASRSDGKAVCPCGARRVDRQIGLEQTPQEWVDNLVAVFRECRRVLADHGTLWAEIGDSYNASTRGAGGDGKQHTNAGSVPEDRSWHIAEGCKPKDLLGQPWMLAFALRADGWYLRSEIIWARPNPMPESVNRPTKAHSTVFLSSKRPRYFYDADAIREPHQPATSGLNPHGARGDQYKLAQDGHTNGEGSHPTARDGHLGFHPSGANARSVWNIPTQPTPFAHFATWPQKLVARMIQAGTSERGRCPECGKPWVRQTESVLHPVQKNFAHTAPRDGFHKNPKGHIPAKQTVTTLGWSPSCDHHTKPVPCTVLDPFAGSGTTLLVARNHQRHAIGIELNADYCALAADRLSQLSLLTGDAA